MRLLERTAAPFPAQAPLYIHMMNLVLPKGQGTERIGCGEGKNKKKIIICSLQEKKTLRFLFLFDQYFPVYGLAPPDACLYQGREVVCGRRAGYFSLRVLAALAAPSPAVLCWDTSERGSWTDGRGRAPAHPPGHPPRRWLKLFSFYFVLFKWKQAHTAAS